MGFADNSNILYLNFFIGYSEKESFLNMGLYAPLFP